MKGDRLDQRINSLITLLSLIAIEEDDRKEVKFI